MEILLEGLNANRRLGMEKDLKIHSATECKEVLSASSKLQGLRINAY
jgi:hypothetical protein